MVGSHLIPGGQWAQPSWAIGSRSKKKPVIRSKFIIIWSISYVRYNHIRHKQLCLCNLIAFDIDKLKFKIKQKITSSKKRLADFTFNTDRLMIENLTFLIRTARVWKCARISTATVDACFLRCALSIWFAGDLCNFVIKKWKSVVRESFP